MPRISTYVTKDQKKKFEDMAEKQGLSTAEWFRRCIRTATRLWDADGGFNRSTLDAWYEQIEELEVSNSDFSRDQNQPVDSDIQRLILRELSTTEPTDLDEIQELVTEEIVEDTLYELHQEQKIEYIPGKGYQKR